MLLAAAFAFAVLRLERSQRIVAVLLRLQDTTTQIRVRGAFVLLVAFVTLASLLGLETILGAFIAGGDSQIRGWGPHDDASAISPEA